MFIQNCVLFGNGDEVSSKARDYASGGGAEDEVPK